MRKVWITSYLCWLRTFFCFWPTVRLWLQVARDKQFKAQNLSKYSSDLFLSVPLKLMGKESHSREKDRHRCYRHSQTRRTINRSFAYDCEASSNDLLIGESHMKRKPSPSNEQVGDMHSPRVKILDVEMVNASNDLLHVSSTPRWSNEDSNGCSIASCSSIDFADSHHKSLENTSKSSDAKSSYPTLSGKKHMLSTPRYNIDVNIHELELHAYESTVQALYASGPLSWEQESFLTNLRISLNISDDEHLFQLRHLLSSQVV